MERYVVAFPDDEFALAVFQKLEKIEDGFCFNPIEKLVFRDKEVKIRIRDNVRKSECFFIHDSNRNPSDWLLEIAFVNEALHNSSVSEITDVFPYLRFSRQDRKDKSRVAQNAKVVANVINLCADRVVTLDVHAPQIALASSIPFDNLYSFSIVIDHLIKNHPNILENIMLMSPDAGGAKRVEAFRNRLSYSGIDSDIVIGYKSRPREGEIGVFKMIGDVENKNVIIIDDIIDSGKTLVEAAQELRKRGAKKIYAYGTHALFTEGVDKVVENFERVFVSDTLKQTKHEKLEIISVAELFAEAIKRISNGESLSELFETKKD